METRPPHANTRAGATLLPSLTAAYVVVMLLMALLPTGIGSAAASGNTPNEPCPTPIADDTHWYVQTQCHVA